MIEVVDHNNAKLGSIETRIQEFTGFGYLGLCTEDDAANVLFNDYQDCKIHVEGIHSAIASITLKWSKVDHLSLVLYQNRTEILEQQRAFINHEDISIYKALEKLDIARGSGENTTIKSLKIMFKRSELNET